MEQVPTPRNESHRFDSYPTTTIIKLLVKYIKGALPEGRSLPDDIWQSRHWGIRTLLWLHAIGIVCFGLIMGASLEHSLAERYYETLELTKIKIKISVPAEDDQSD